MPAGRPLSHYQSYPPPLQPDMFTPGVDALAQNSNLDPRKVQDHFEDFSEDLFEELSKYGEIENMNICDNIADHMVGNVCVQFREEHAANALQNLTGRFYAGVGFKQELFGPSGLSVRLYFPANIVSRQSLRKQSDVQHFFRTFIVIDFSHVTDFREATCWQYEENVCNRGGYCNFMHLKKISRELRRWLFGRSRHRHSRSRSPHKHPSHEHRGHGSRGSGRREDDRERPHQDRDRRPRSRSPGGRRNWSPARESSMERHAMIEQWNRERE